MTLCPQRTTCSNPARCTSSQCAGMPDWEPGLKDEEDTIPWDFDKDYPLDNLEGEDNGD